MNKFQNHQLPHFNLQLFNDSDEFQSDDNLNEKINERRDTSSTKQSEEDIDYSESLLILV